MPSTSMRMSPVFGKSESDEFDGASAFDGEEEGVFDSEVVECPSEVSGRNEGCFVGGDNFVAAFETGFGGGGVGLDFSDGGAVVLGEGEADGFRCGHGVAETEGEFHGGREWQIWKREGMIFNAEKCDSFGGVFSAESASCGGDGVSVCLERGSKIRFLMR